MARGGGGESKQGLIITLIFFILATIILGVTTYLGFDGQTELKKQATQAVEDKKKWENNSDWHEFEAKVYRAYLGNMLPKDADRLGQLREKFDGNSLKSDDAAKEDVTKDIREKLDKGEGLGWNAAEKKPKETMGGLVTILRKRVAELEKNWDAEKA